MVLQVPILLGLSRSLKPDSLHYTSINVKCLFRGRSVQQCWLVPLELASFPTRSTHSSSQPLFQRADSKMHLSEKALQMSPPSVHFAWVLQGSAASSLFVYSCICLHIWILFYFSVHYCMLYDFILYVTGAQCCLFLIMFLKASLNPASIYQLSASRTGCMQAFDKWPSHY